MSKLSIRFFNDREVRAVWDDANAKWWFVAVDIVAILSESADARNYWYVLKSRLKKANSETLTNCKGFKLTAPDGKKHETDCFDSDGIIRLAQEFQGIKARPFLSASIKALVQSALTNKINDRETFLKGIDYSYYYEQEPAP